MKKNFTKKSPTISLPFQEWERPGCQDGRHKLARVCAGEGSELRRRPHTTDGDNSTFARSSPGLTLSLCKMGTETFLARWWWGSDVHIKTLIITWLH